jgi:hypothetical protein
MRLCSHIILVFNFNYLGFRDESKRDEHETGVRVYLERVSLRLRSSRVRNGSIVDVFKSKRDLFGAPARGTFTGWISALRTVPMMRRPSTGFTGLSDPATAGGRPLFATPESQTSRKNVPW